MTAAVGTVDPQVVIDADGHVREPDDLWLGELGGAWGDQAPRVHTDDGGLFISVGGREVPARQKYARQVESLTPADVDRFEEAMADGFSAASQLAAMDREGVDHSVLFPTHGLALMGVDGVAPALTTAIAEVYNTWLAGFCAEGRGRLSGVGMVDPRDVEGAVGEARRCVEDLDFVGVFVRPNPVGGRSWHDAAYEPLWSAIEELDVPLCFHEGGAVLLPQVAVDRFDVHAFWHVCTHPMEQQMAMVAVLLGGVAERHPALRMAFLECGASWLPYWMWRMDEHVEAEPTQFSGLSLRPSEYVRRQCFVGIDSDEERLGGLDHGVFLPFILIYPHADVPIVQRSLQRDLDPGFHLALGRALAPLRDEDVLIVGSGLSYHNLRKITAADAQTVAEAEAFDAWLRDAVEQPDAGERERRLMAWAQAPGARACHPRSEHLVPLFVAAGAGGGDPGGRNYADPMLGKAVSGFRFGSSARAEGL